MSVRYKYPQQAGENNRQQQDIRMRKNNINVSTFILQGIINRRSNIIIEKIIHLLFRKVDFGNEGLSILKEYSNKGHVIYGSFQSSITSTLILNNILRRHGFDTPELALGNSPYLLQLVTGLFNRIYRFISDLFNDVDRTRISDEEHIKNVVQSGHSILIALLSQKLFISNYLKERPDTLEYLLKIQKDMEEPIFIFPQIIFWNRNPEKTKAKRTFMEMRATGDRGLFSGLFAMWKSITPAFVRIATPINLKEEIKRAGHDDIKNLAREIRSRLLETYDYEKRSILGPVIKSRQEMMEQVLYHSNTLDTIQLLMKDEGLSEKKLRRNAYKYFDEIAADFSIITIKYFEKTLRFIFRKIFDGIEYDIEDIKKIREASRKGPVVIAPSHKSHMDYLIVSSIFYREKMIPPHIVAGANLTFFPMGLIFRKSGAFFMRRSFKGMKLYTTILKQYIKTLVSEGYSIEFFIEGGRTRSGKLLTPKMGILKYMIEAIEEGYAGDMVFVPATINYNRILEENSYHKELKGKEKKSESTSNFVKSRSLLKRNYGKVYLSFNDPVYYSDLKKQYDTTGEDVSAIADHLMEKISDIAMATPVSMVSTALLSSPGRGFQKEALLARITHLVQYFSGIKAPLAKELQNQDSIAIQLDSILDEFMNDGIISDIRDDRTTPDKSSMEDIYLLDEEDRPKINFYKNTIINHLYPLSYASLAVLMRSEKESVPAGDVEKIFLSLRSLFFMEFINHGDEAAGLAFNDSMQFLQDEKMISMHGEEVKIHDNKFVELRNNSAIIQDYLESYYIAFSALLPLSSKTEKKELINLIRKKGVQMYHMEEIKLPESLSIANYSNALNYLIKNKILIETSSGKKEKILKVIEPLKLAAIHTMIHEYLLTLNIHLLKKRADIIPKERIDTGDTHLSDKVH